MEEEAPRGIFGRVRNGRSGGSVREVGDWGCLRAQGGHPKNNAVVK